MRSLLDNPLVWLAVGLTSGALGAALLADLPATREQLAQVRDTRPFSAAAPGNVAFVEGTMAHASSSASQHDLVVYVREAYRSGSARTSTWVETARSTPAFSLASRDGVVRVVNDTYRLETTAVTIEEAPASLTRGAIRVRGFRVGSHVLAVGRKGSPPGSFEAVFVAAGTRDDYLEQRAAFVTRAASIGLTLLLAGAAGALRAVRLLRRSRETS